MEIYMRMKAVYGDYSYSHMTVVEWCNKFWQKRESTKDLAHPGPACVAAHNGGILLHDNARLNVTQTTQDLLGHMK